MRHRGLGAAGVGRGGGNSGEVLVAGCQETGVQGPSLSSPILTVWNPCFHHSGTAGYLCHSFHSPRELAFYSSQKDAEA